MKPASGPSARVRLLKITLVFGIIATFVMLLRESELLGAFRVDISKPVPLRRTFGTGRADGTTIHRHTPCPGGCAWTGTWSCPDQALGSRGPAGDDGTEAYRCCCGANQGWKAESSTAVGSEKVGDSGGLRDGASELASKSVSGSDACPNSKSGPVLTTTSGFGPDPYVKLATLEEKLTYHKGGEWRPLQRHDSSVHSSKGRASLFTFPCELDVAGLVPQDTIDQNIGSCYFRQDESFKSQHPHGLHSMFGAKVGNQCGCINTAFRTSPVSFEYHSRTGVDKMPIDRLVEAVAGKTMCLAGDSIDKQWFEVLGHQLHRAEYLGSTPISSVWEGSIQLDDLGCHLDVPKWPGMMKDVGQLDALGKDGQRLARFRYFKFYQFIPGYLDFMRKNCDILVINLSLHWRGDTGKGKDPLSYYPLAVEAAGVYLSNFSNNGKIAIYRETGPQHFPTPDGSYDPGKTTTGLPCRPIQANMTETGVYNTIALAMFHRLSQATAPLSKEDAGNQSPIGEALHKAFMGWTRPGGGPDPLLYTVHANQEAGYLESLTRFWQKENDKGGGKYAGELAHLKAVSERTSGNVYWWPIYDIFNRFHDWHSSDTDCTHFCFTIGPFDAGIERLSLIIAEAVSARAAVAVPDPAPDELVC